jgi:hypothetical protein
LKINVKLSGSNQTLDINSMQHFNEVPCMIMGADVSHPSPQSRDPSCSALVGTIDRHGVVYATSVGIQTSRVEAIEGLDVMAKELLDRFKARNNTYPKRVIVYRFVSLVCPFNSIQFNLWTVMAFPKANTNTFWLTVCLTILYRSELIFRAELNAIRKALNACEEPGSEPITVTYVIAAKRRSFFVWSPFLELTIS